MRRIVPLALAAAFATSLAAPAHALNQNASVPFFLAPFFGSGFHQPAPQPQPHYHQYAPSDPSPQELSRATTRQLVSFGANYAPGTVVISTSQRKLYYVMGGGRAIAYDVGVGREGFQWSGTEKISRKQEWPDWRPPEEMLRRRPDLPRYMAGGPHNPLGARAMYLGSSLFRIHGSNEPETIGHAVSSGCIRMLNADVVDLYERVKVGTTVVVLR